MGDIFGVILAGGQASRMDGADKALVTLGGVPLVSHVGAVLGPQVDALAINANGDPDRFDVMPGCPILPDPLPGHLGPLSGVLAGLDWAAECGADHIVTAACDTPFFPDDVVERLERAATRTRTPIALAGTQEGGRMRRHPTFGYWPVSLRHNLRASLRAGVGKITRWADAHGAATAAFDDGRFFNINTRDDLALAETMLG